MHLCYLNRFLQLWLWCWRCRGCELLQQHSDIKVTDAAGINHIGKEYCGNFHCKTESSKVDDSQVPQPTCHDNCQLLDIHGSWGTWLGGWVQSKYSQFRLCYCSVSKKSLLESLVFVVFQCCLLYLYWVFIQIISAFVFVFGSKTLFSSPL